MIEKVCSKCKVAKPVTEFYKSRNSKDGHNCYCKSCSKQCRKEYQEYYKELKERSEMLVAFRTLKYDIKRSKIFKED